jgi:hypothetical protein
MKIVEIMSATFAIKGFGKNVILNYILKQYMKTGEIMNATFAPKGFLKKAI